MTSNLKRHSPSCFGAPSTVDETVERDASFMAYPDSPEAKEPSPYVAPYMPRTQVEELLHLVRAQPQKKWRAVEQNLLKGLRHNANGKEYPDRRTGEGT